MVDIAGTNIGRNPSYLTNNNQSNKTISQIDSKSSQLSFVNNNNSQPKKFEHIISQYNTAIGQLKQEDEKKKNSNYATNPLNNNSSKDSILASIFGNESTYKAEEKKQDTKRKPVTPDKTFNILSMFKPGEILNVVANNDKQYSFAPKQNLSFMS